MRDFAYGVERVYSPDRWSLVGEAGAFADPFYSPGSDFIGFGNIFTSDLIPVSTARTSPSDSSTTTTCLRLFDYVLSKYEDQYPLFSNVWVAAHKMHLDAFFNHTGITLLAVNNKLADLEFIRSVEDDLDRLQRLHMNMQEMFKQWDELEQRDGRIRSYRRESARWHERS